MPDRPKIISPDTLRGGPKDRYPAEDAIVGGYVEHRRKAALVREGLVVDVVADSRRFRGERPRLVFRPEKRTGGERQIGLSFAVAVQHVLSINAER